MFLSALELRNIIESSFLPKRCQCTLSPDLSMTVKVFARWCKPISSIY